MKILGIKVTHPDKTTPNGTVYTKKSRLLVKLDSISRTNDDYISTINFDRNPIRIAGRYTYTSGSIHLPVNNVATIYRLTGKYTHKVDGESTRHDRTIMVMICGRVFIKLRTTLLKDGLIAWWSPTGTNLLTPNIYNELIPSISAIYVGCHVPMVINGVKIPQHIRDMAKTISQDEVPVIGDAIEDLIGKNMITDWLHSDLPYHNPDLK